MPLPQPLTTTDDPCGLADRWLIDIRLATLLLSLSRAILSRSALRALVPVGKLLMLISGFRSAEQQDALRRTPQGRPVAATDRSTHTSCPATGADLRLEGFMNINDPASRRVWLEIGRAAEDLGLRWGGGSRRDPDGIPIDFNHFDLGPRR